MASAQEPVTIVGAPVSRQLGPGSYEIKVSVQVHQPLTVPQVPIVASYLRFVAPTPVPGWIQEDDVLGSLYEVDLNGDGRLTAVEVRERDGTLRIDHFPVEVMGGDEMGPQAPYKADGSPRKFTLGPYAPDFMVMFAQLPWIGLDLQHRGYDPEIQLHPNPSLQIMVFEGCAGPSNPQDLPGEPTFKVGWRLPEETDRRLTFNWEPNVLPQWMRAEWKVFPIANQPGVQDFVFQVDIEGPIGVWAQVNYALEPGVRLRGTPVIGRLTP